MDAHPAHTSRRLTRRLSGSPDSALGFAVRYTAERRREIVQADVAEQAIAVSF